MLIYQIRKINNVVVYLQLHQEFDWIFNQTFFVSGLFRSLKMNYGDQWLIVKSNL